MNISVQNLPSGTILVALIGKMDMKGAMDIDIEFNSIVQDCRLIIVDMSGVEFLASMGLRTLIMGAKSIHSRSGKMVLLAPNSLVAEVLHASGTDVLIPVVHDRAEAERFLAS